MTIDEQGRVIHETVNFELKDATLAGDFQVTEYTAHNVSLLENPDMLKSTFAMIANSLVEASDVVARIAAIEVELKRLQNALDVANDQAAVAIRERDAALNAKDAALRREEIANSAYDTVNAARIEAQAEAHQLRQERDAAQDANQGLVWELEEARAKIAELEEHLATRTINYNTLKEVSNDFAKKYDEASTERDAFREKARDFEDLYTLALEDTKKLTLELNNVRADRNAHEADAEIAWKEANKLRTSLAEIRAIVGDR